MNGTVAWWVRNPVAANLLMAGILIAGVFGFLNFDREVFPVMRQNQVDVAVAWPGAAPQEVEEQIVERIEESLNDLRGVRRITALAQEGLATVSVVAEPGIELAQFAADIKRRVDAVSGFPVDIERPVVNELQGRDEALRIAVYGDAGERELKRIAEELRDQVAALPGISVVSLFGVRREEVAIELSQQEMRRYGLGFDEVARAVRGSSINLSAGSVRTESGDVQLRSRNLADTEADFARIVVRESPDGGMVRLGDVARIVDGFEDNEILATLNGEPAVLVQVLSFPHMDVVKISDSVKAWLPTARAALPPGVKLDLWFDSADMYRGRMQTLASAALNGLLLVCLILMLSLRPKVAFWVTAGIGTAYAGACALLPGLGVSINMMSTFAFMLVLGIMVDDAIVIGESVHAESESRGGGPRAAIEGTRLVARPVLFGVLTMMVAFMPWFFLSGMEAQLTRQISIVIVLSLLFSLAEAFLILPSHLVSLGPQRATGRLGRLQQRVAAAITGFAAGPYRRYLESVHANRMLIAAIFASALLLGIGLLSSGWVRFSFMPDIEGQQVAVNIELPDGVPYSRALQVLAQLQQAEQQLVDEVNAMGEGRLVESWYTRSRRDSVIAVVNLVPPEQRALSSKQTADRLRALIGEVPDAEAITVMHSLNFKEPPLQYSVTHADPDQLAAAVAALRRRLEGYSAVYDLRDNLRDATEELRFSLLPGAERLGLDLAEVSRQVRQAYFGQEVQRLPREGNDVKVMLRYPRESRNNLYSLGDFRLRTADGREVPLLAVVELEYRPGVQRIERRDRARAVLVSAELREAVRHDVDRDLQENFIPGWKQEFPGVGISAVGEAESESEFMLEVASLYAVALFIMYALIAVAFRSYWRPLIIMSAIPFGLVGAVIGHIVYDMPLAIFSWFGVGAAIGVVINDNLVLVDCILRMREQGMDAVQAVVQAGVQRFRPILLTSITTFVGLLPMMADPSIEAQFLQPTTVALAWGVALATFVTLLLTPALYLIGEDFVEVRSRLRAVTNRGFSADRVRRGSDQAAG